jgi:hypothetical protein
VIAPSAIFCGSPARTSCATQTARRVRSVSEWTAVDSMSSANASKYAPCELWKRAPASARRMSRRGAENEGRYQPTTLMWAACAASRRWPMPSGCRTSREARSFDVSTKSVWMWFARSVAITRFGWSSACVS